MNNSHNKLYVLEGPDGTGKSTLANELKNATNGNVIHATFNKDWDIKKYHIEILESANKLRQYGSVILDRWAISEHIYGPIFRGEEQYDVMNLVDKRERELNDAVWIYCRNDNAVENHLRNKETRDEMFDDMTEVVKSYDQFIAIDCFKREWLVYDFGKIAVEDFVNKII